ncbi:MAG: hypothetical protein COS90_11010 [Deltaproteobacteria bacterium CG07_land_8_20_14_0_80_60_11]|nr:MAG: hypothetical protein COS90_11010 [Deltaproteobacteria bacterium CG07_land_8_20_14_0_80_60_11]
MAIPRRGIQDIRTLTGKVRRALLPHEAYLRISHIEMEKARKTLESEKARQLVADIAARLVEIEAEKEVLLQGLRDRGSDPPPVRSGPPKKIGGFKVRY